MSAADQRNAFVVGWPVAHSRSPLIHRFWLGQYGIAGEYIRKAVPPEEVEAFLTGFGAEFVGGNVTLPHKESAFRLCRETTPVARRLKAVNTVWLEAGRLCGDNTDAFGFTANLDRAAPPWRGGETALVLGAGGASRAVVQALLDVGFRTVFLLNRTVARAAALAAHFGPPVRAENLDSLVRRLPEADLVINATSAGMDGQAPLSVDWAVARKGTIATDLVYIPLLTPFLAGAAQRGLTTVDGLGMLLHQAVPGFERWFGVRPEVTEHLRQHIVADLPA